MLSARRKCALGVGCVLNQGAIGLALRSAPVLVVRRPGAASRIAAVAAVIVIEVEAFGNCAGPRLKLADPCPFIAGK